MKHRAIAVLVAMGLLTGCTLGPNYQRPSVPVPQSFYAPQALPTAESSSLADLLKQCRRILASRVPISFHKPVRAVM
jgi:hypothetical protein